MQDFLDPVEAVKVETALGAVYVAPTGLSTLTINAPHLTIDGTSLQASGILVSGDGLNWNFLQQHERESGRFTLAPDALRARLVDGREADIVTLGKLGEAVLLAVRKLSQTNSGLFLESRATAFEK